MPKLSRISDQIILTLALAAAVIPARVFGQQEGPITTQALVGVDSKSPDTLNAADLTAKVNDHATPLTSFMRVPASGAQVALLIDDGLRESVGRQLGDLQAFVRKLQPGTEIFIGYMQNGRVAPAQTFTTDYEAAAKALRLPLGTPGVSASPYFCLSDVVKKWPEGSGGTESKARFVLMLTNGVDPYNGSVSPLNQDSPYVETAANDAQRAGVAVYSIYYGNAGIRGGAATVSGQNYLSQVADATGGQVYLQGLTNPVSLAPFLAQFQRDVSETYVATFPAVAHRENTLVRLKLSTNRRGTRLRAPANVHPRESRIADASASLNVLPATFKSSC